MTSSTGVLVVSIGGGTGWRAAARELSDAPAEHVLPRLLPGWGS